MTISGGSKFYADLKQADKDRVPTVQGMKTKCENQCKEQKTIKSGTAGSRESKTEILQRKTYVTELEDSNWKGLIESINGI